MTVDLKLPFGVSLPRYRGIPELPFDRTDTSIVTVEDAMRYFSESNVNSRAGIEALIRAKTGKTTPVFVAFRGDKEFTRDKHNIFGVSVGTGADIYVTPSIPEAVSRVYTGTCSVARAAKETDPTTIQYTVTIPFTDSAGAYFISKAVPVETDTAVIELSPEFRPSESASIIGRGSRVPEIAGYSISAGAPYELAFSAFQGEMRATISLTKEELDPVIPDEVDRYIGWSKYWEIQDTIDATSPTGVTLAAYRDMQKQAVGGIFSVSEVFESECYILVQLIRMPNLIELQEHVGNQDISVGDLLVKAPVPVFVQVSADIYGATDTEEGADRAKKGISAAINRYRSSSFELISASTVTSYVSSAVEMFMAGNVGMPVYMTCSMFLPDESFRSFNVTNRTQIDVGISSVSSKTSAAFSYPELVNLNIAAD